MHVKSVCKCEIPDNLIKLCALELKSYKVVKENKDKKLFPLFIHDHFFTAVDNATLAKVLAEGLM